MVTTHDLIALAKARTPCVTIYLPTHRHGPATVSDGNHLHAILKEATKSLGARGISAAVADSAVSPLRALARHDPFWQEQREGLALFASPQHWAHYSLPRPVRKQLIVNDIFFMRQLIPFRDGDETFHVLALDRHGPRLYRGDRDSLNVIPVPGMPESMDEALWYEFPQSQLQFRSSGSGTAMFHGHGQGEELDKEAIARYFRHLDDAVAGVLDDPNVPLVLAGVGYYVPIYRSVSSLANIVDGFVEGSMERRSDAEIHAVSWQVVRDRFERPMRDRMDRFENMIGTGLTLDSLPDILEAATEGRVDTLFIGDTSTAVDEVSESYLNTAVRRCLLTGGRVYEAPMMVTDPDRASALLRY